MDGREEGQRHPKCVDSESVKTPIPRTSKTTFVRILHVGDPGIHVLSKKLNITMFLVLRKHPSAPSGCRDKGKYHPMSRGGKYQLQVDLGPLQWLPKRAK